MGYNFSPKIVTDGLVLYLDAGNTKSYISGSTIWNDLSKNKYIGNLINGTYINENNGVISFNGVSTYCEILNSGVSLALQEYTYGAWIFVTNFGVSNDRNLIFSKWGNSTGQQINIHLNTIPTKEISYSVASNSTVYSLTSNSKINENTWTKVDIVYSSGSAFLYINGILDKTTNWNITNPIATGLNNNLHIGKYDFTWTNYKDEFSGNISNVLVYNRPLTSQEILKNYNTTKRRFGL